MLSQLETGPMRLGTWLVIMDRPIIGTVQEMSFALFCREVGRRCKYREGFYAHVTICVTQASRCWREEPIQKIVMPIRVLTFY